MNYSRHGSILFLAVGILGLLLFLHLIELPNDTFLLRELQNSGHAPMFGLLSLLILPLSRLLLVGFHLRPIGLYGVALVVTMLLAITSEALQIKGPRDADLLDLLRDLIGAVSFLAVRWSFDPRASTECGARFSRIRIRWLLGGIILFLLFMAPLAIWTAAYIHRDTVFPRVTSLDSYLANKFLVVNGGELEMVASPDGWTNSDGSRVGRLVIGPGKYPGLTVSEPYPDWSGYEYLEFCMFSARSDTVRLILRINDRQHDNRFSDRYNRRLIVEPGLNQFSLSLMEVAQAPRTREMDMADIRAVVVFADNPVEEIVVYLDDMRLR